MRGLGYLLILALLFVVASPSPLPAAEPEARPNTQLTIATGVGVPFMIGTGMELMISRFVPGVEARARDFADEREVVRLVSQGEVALGLVPIPEIARAFPAPADRARSGLRFLMGGHAASVAHLFVPLRAPIVSVADLKGRRLAVPGPGSPGEAMAAALLAAHGLAPGDVEVIPLGAGEQVEALRAGRVDAAFMVAPLPSPLASSPGPEAMTKAGDVRLLSIGDAELQALIEAAPGLSRHTIEAGTYPGQTEAIRTIASKNALIVHEGVDEVLAYRIVQAILEHPAEFQQVCPLGVAYTPKNALPGTPLLPLHAGAERYYRERGLLLAARGGSASTDWYDVSRLIEIRPAGGNVVGPGADLMPQDLVERVRGVPGIIRIEAYLFVGLVDRSKERPFSIVGGHPPGATFRVNCHNVEAVRIVEGRGLGASDAGQRVAVAGTLYAETYAPPGERRLPVGATIDLVQPGMEAGGLSLPREARVEVVGIFSSGFRLGDSQVLLPLDTAQTLFGLEGKVSKLLVTVEAPEARDRVAEALRARLGEEVDVIYPRLGGMRGMP